MEYLFENKNLLLELSYVYVQNLEHILTLVRSSFFSFSAHESLYKPMVL